MRRLRLTKRGLSDLECGLYDHVPAALLNNVRLVTVPLIPGGYAGLTIGPLVFVRDQISDADFNALVAHELVHVQQWNDLGARRFLQIYLTDFARGLKEHRNWNDAYRGISLEVEARATATEIATRRSC